MRVRVEPFWLPKDGNSPAEYEDAFWPPRSLTTKRGGVKCAVADGATETSFSGMWARLLVEAYCSTSGRDELIASLPRLQANWQAAVTSQPLPWYAEQKLLSGAYAALLGLELTIPPGPRAGTCTWTAFAIGDACLVQMRGNELVSAFPLTTPEQFDNHPFLIGSVPQADSPLEPYERCAAGEFERADTIYLMTDALACWFLSQQAEFGPHDYLAGVSEADLYRLVREQRRERSTNGGPQMRNDDVTLVRVTAVR